MLASSSLNYQGLMERADALEKTLMLGKIQGGRRRGQQRMRWLDGITDSMDMSVIPVKMFISVTVALLGNVTLSYIRFPTLLKTVFTCWLI